MNYLYLLMELIDLPVELLIAIFNKLYVRSLQSLSVSCSYFNNIINKPKKYFGRRHGKYHVDEYNLIYKDDRPITAIDDNARYYVENNCIIQNEIFRSVFIRYTIDGYLISHNKARVVITNINKLHIDEFISITGSGSVGVRNGDVVINNNRLCTMSCNLHPMPVHYILALYTVCLRLPTIIIDFFNNRQLV